MQAENNQFLNEFSRNKKQMTCFTFTDSMSIVSFHEEKKSAYKNKVTAHKLPNT